MPMSQACPSVIPAARSIRKPMSNYSIIPTAVVHLSVNAEAWYQARAILDTGSETSLITHSCAKRIGLHISNMNSRIAGVGGSTDTKIIGCTCSIVHQQYGYPQLLVPFFVVNKVTLDLPSNQLPFRQWPHLSELDLADPEFYRPRSVDIIFSGDILNSVLLNEVKPSLRGSPVAQYTTFGWIISGGYSQVPRPRVHFSDQVEIKELPICEPQVASINRYEHIQAIGTSQARPQRSDWHDLRSPSEPKVVPNYSPLKNQPIKTTTQSSRLTLAPVSLRHRSSTPIQDPQYAELLDRMFRIESVEPCSPHSPEEILAEELFRKSMSRLPDGRFQVSLPFKVGAGVLGESKTVAMKQFRSLERRLRRSPNDRLSYNKFMRDYIDQQHMELAPNPPSRAAHFYLPHHSVRRPDDPPDKIRVVFNASQATTSKLSLNDLLLPGPKLQLDMCEVLTRFRQDKWVFIADVKQMFRQIAHPPADRDYLRILWRFTEDEPIQEYRLCTVTYGTASAPFLAGRVLMELASIYKQSHPTAANILETRTYVDDLNGGGESLLEAISARLELQYVLSSAHLELRKWAANDERILDGIPEDHLLPSMKSVQLEEESTSSLKILGLSWQPHSDSFHYMLRPMEAVHTKRQLASQIARVYDPLGWLIPLTVYARSIFRSVIQNHLDWDENLPPSVTSEWSRLAQELPELRFLQIPRYVPVSLEVQWLIGFSDASERAYAAVVYLLSASNDNVTVSLIASRARMAPIKAMTLPRLELCAAQLLARTMTKVMPSMKNVRSDRVLAFSDSEITLSWITAEKPPLWKIFVGNRVADILGNVEPSQWYHVSSKDNPADHASRGLRPRELVECTQWWNGPSWMKGSLELWPVKRIRPDMSDSTVLSEARTSRTTVSLTSLLTEGRSRIEDRFSSATTLQNVVGFCIRFINRLRIKRTLEQQNDLKTHYRTVQSLLSSPTPNSEWLKINLPLSTEERSAALDVLIRRAQAQGLANEISDVQTRRPRLRICRSLGLFVDSQGVLRVGGRLRNSQLPDTEKHPALLPSQHPLTKLLIERSHRSLLHAGPLSTLHDLRSKFWIVNGKNVVRRQLAKCVDCFTIRPRPYQPEMGQLPQCRTHLESPFATTGVDYAGPFPCSIAGLRGNKILNCYLAIFVCFAVKAVHIEVVTDLTTAGFLQAYRRFVSRRGHPHTMWSDNGRNFLGAANELRRVQTLLQSPEHRSAVVTETAINGTSWKFIPPSAPFFGGLWEAAVKQAKRLLKNCLRDQVPTLETFSTIITQVEAILNSRPLTAASSSPDDLQVLTPAHFLIFRPLTLPPSEPDLTARSLRDRHSFSQYIFQNFWHRWKKEYLQELQCRAKWDTPSRPARIGDLVVIINDNTPPLTWTLGKIISLQPGNDGVSRVAEVRTSSGTLSRPVRKLCPLPEDVCGTVTPTAGEDVRS